ncbi:hypothetical protein [Dactylosporangium sp. CA-233914]|uniref:hypothetical protein n=1 Tax=Dactylosporangium sp. CA-233914 TaxID=3239934 RepID=UPI003D8DEE55
MSADARLCAFLGLALDRREPPPRRELHWRLHAAVERATTLAGIEFARVYLQQMGDGGLIVFPAGVDEPGAIAALLTVLRFGLPPAGRTPVRLRLAIVRGRPAVATIQAARLASGPALSHDPDATLAVLAAL